MILFLTFISSCVLFDSYVLLADDHVNNKGNNKITELRTILQRESQNS